MKLKLSTNWEVKVKGSKKSIQLFDEYGNKVEGCDGDGVIKYECNDCYESEGLVQQGEELYCPSCLEDRMEILNKKLIQKTEGF